MNPVIGQIYDYKNIVELNAGVGSLEYMNSVAVPSGLPGTSTHLEYKGSQMNFSKSNRQFDFYIKSDYAYLMRKSIISDINIPYHHFEIKAGANWSWEIPLSIPNFRLNTGGGFSINSLAGYNKNLNYNTVPHEIMYPYGNWHISPDVHLIMSYKLNKISFQSGISIPILAVGFFQEYEYFQYSINDTNDYLRYVLTPNSIASPMQYLNTNSFLSATYLFSETKPTHYYLKISVNQEYLHANIFNNTEMKNNCGVSLSLIILKK